MGSRGGQQAVDSTLRGTVTRLVLVATIRANRPHGLVLCFSALHRKAAKPKEYKVNPPKSNAVARTAKDRVKNTPNTGSHKSSVLKLANTRREKVSFDAID